MKVINSPAKGDQLFGLGLINGYLRAARTYKALAKEDNAPYLLCIPDEVDGYQAFEVFKKYATQNPEHLHWSPDITIYISFKNAWPCQHQNK